MIIPATHSRLEGKGTIGELGSERLDCGVGTTGRKTLVVPTVHLHLIGRTSVGDVGAIDTVHVGSREPRGETTKLGECRPGIPRRR